MAAFAAALAFACGTRPSAHDSQIRVIDLVARFSQVERRPEGGSFAVVQQTLGERTRATLVVPSHSRLIWDTRLPRRATLHADVALPPSSPASTVRFRIGVSDDRVYDKLVERVVTTDDTARQGWIPLQADLRLYAGRQWSVFYRPEGRVWRLVLSTDHLDGAAIGAWWAEPGVETDTESARRFHHQYGTGR